MSGLTTWKDRGLLSDDCVQRLSTFACLIQEWNPRINLTGFHSLAEIEEILIGESVSALLGLRLSTSLVLDFGSGAGIPGLVWQICEPSLAVTSLEIRQKKVAFQKEVRRVLGLNAEIVCGRFPDAVAGRRFDWIVSRAIRFRAPVWDAAGALLASNGHFVRFAGPGATEEGWASIPVSPATTVLVHP